MLSMDSPRAHKQKNLFPISFVISEGYLLLEVMFSLVILVGFTLAFASYQVNHIKQQAAMIQQLKAVDYAHDLIERISFLHESPPANYEIDGITLHWEKMPPITMHFEQGALKEAREHIVVTARWHSETGMKQYCLHSVVS